MQERFPISSMVSFMGMGPTQERTIEANPQQSRAHRSMSTQTLVTRIPLRTQPQMDAVTLDFRCTKEKHLRYRGDWFLRPRYIEILLRTVLSYIGVREVHRQHFERCGRLVRIIHNRSISPRKTGCILTCIILKTSGMDAWSSTPANNPGISL